jgi:hypothetical protein
MYVAAVMRAGSGRGRQGGVGGGLRVTWHTKMFTVGRGSHQRRYLCYKGSQLSVTDGSTWTVLAARLTVSLGSQRLQANRFCCPLRSLSFLGFLLRVVRLANGWWGLLTSPKNGEAGVGSGEVILHIVKMWEQCLIARVCCAMAGYLA